MTAIEKAAARVVEIAAAEIGYCEKASNDQLNDKTANAGTNNYTKYAAFFDAQRGTYNFYNGRKNGPAGEWCDMFVDWCMCQAFGMDTARKMLYQPMDSCGAGCYFSAQYFKSNNAWASGGTVPKVGDQIFFGKKGDESHTGLVVDVSADKVWTIEGNANNRVMRRVYAISDGNIAGYGRPNYSLVADSFEGDVTPDTPIKDDVDTPVSGKTCTVTLPVLSIGARGEFVETLQLLLKHYVDSEIAIDGYFGPQTDRIVRWYQKYHNEEVDGIVGPITWRLLLR